MHRGATRPSGLIAAIPPFALFAYLVLAGNANTVIQLSVLLVAALLALRGVGLKRGALETDVLEKRISAKAEFEGPEDPDDHVA